MASANPDLSLFVCPQDHGFIQHSGFVQVVQTEFHITKEEHLRRKALPWPGSAEGTITTTMPPLRSIPGAISKEPPNVIEGVRKPPRREH